MDKDTYIMSAPAQNRHDFTDSIERTLPMIGARALNYLRGDDGATIECWNNIGAKMDLEYEMSGSNTAREDYESSLIEQRYDLYRRIGIMSDSVFEIVCDNSPAFMEWSMHKLKTLHEKNVIYEDSEDMLVCNDCDRTLIMAIDNVKNLSCQCCRGKDFRIENRKSLFIDIKKEAPQILSPKNMHGIINDAVKLPKKVSIENSREYGLNLGFIGSDYTLDPKIGISLLPEYIAEKAQREKLIIIQGQDTLYNTAPYTNVMSSQLDVRYILPGNIPKNFSPVEIKSLGANFFKFYLPLVSMEKRGNISEKLLDQLYQEYKNTLKKIAAYKDIAPNGEFELDAVNSDLADFFNCIDQGEFTIGLSKARKRIISKLGAAGMLSCNVNFDNNLAKIVDIYEYE